mgnify:CR=1 FL=1
MDDTALKEIADVMEFEGEGMGQQETVDMGTGLPNDIEFKSLSGQMIMSQKPSDKFAYLLDPAAGGEEEEESS